MTTRRSHRIRLPLGMSLMFLVCFVFSGAYAQEEGLKTEVVTKKIVGGKEGVNLPSFEISAAADATQSSLPTGIQSVSMPLWLPNSPDLQYIIPTPGTLRTEPKASEVLRLKDSSSALESLSQQYSPASSEKFQPAAPMQKTADCVDCSLNSVERVMDEPRFTPQPTVSPGPIDRSSLPEAGSGNRNFPGTTSEIGQTKSVEAMPSELLPKGRKGEAGGGQSAPQPVRISRPSEVILNTPPLKLENGKQASDNDGAPLQNNPTSWQSILFEGFAATFPANWQLLYNNAAPYFWDDVAANPHSGSRSGWCAGGTIAPNPVPNPNTDFYVNNMNSWMIYGPFDLSDATDAKLDFWYWLNSELNFDYFWWAASIDASTFYGFATSGNTNGYVSQSFDLKNVPTLGNLTGRSGVYIAFIFQSDASVTNRGVFLDDVDLQKFVPTQTVDLVADRVYLRTGPNSGDPDVACPIAGQPYYVHIDFRNAGTGTASNYLVQIRLNGTVLCSGNFTTAGGASETAWCTAALTWPSGANTIEGVLDVNNVIGETNEGNNSTSRAYTPGPELVADRMYLRTGPNSGAFVDVPLPGQSYYAHMDWRNTSSTSANNFRLEIKFNGSVLCSNSSQSIGPNASVITWCTAALTWPGGGATIEGLLDVNGVITECIENNNSAARIYGYQTYNDFELICQVRSAENFGSNPGADFCLVYGYQDEQHYYYVMFNRNTNDTRVFKIRGTVRTEIGNLGTFVIPDVNYHEVKLRRTGSTMQVFFDNVSLGTATDGEYGQGGVGIGSFNDSSMWDDICIRRLGANSCDFDDNFEDLNANDWIPLHLSRWQVITHQGDHSYYLNTTNFENQYDGGLGEYSLLSSQIELVADDMFVRTGPNSGNIVTRGVAGVPYYVHFDWRNTGKGPANGFLFQIRAINQDTCGYNGNALAFSSHNSWCTDAVVFPTAGTYTLQGTLDYTNVLFEHNKTNNVRNETFVVDPPAIDLVAGQVYLRTGQNSGTIVNNPIPGQQYFLHFDWSNTGSTAATFRLEIKLNNNTHCSGDVTGQPNSNNVTWCTSPVTWPSSSNTIRGELDTNNIIAESNENNNATSRTYPPAPDLIADRVYLRTGPNSGNEVTNPVAGVPYYLHMDWRNLNAAVGAFRLELRTDGNILCFNASQTAGANTNNVSWCTSAVSFTAGTHTLAGQLDVNNVHVEVLENNNTASATVQVGQGAQADLVAGRMYLRTGQNSGDEVTTPIAGVPYFVHFDWQNAGAVAANGFRFDITVDGALSCSNSNANAPANTSFVSWCTTPATFTAGMHTLGGALDVNNVISELSENNNVVGRTIDVAAPPSCNPQACSGPALFPVPEGGTVVGEPITGLDGATVCVDIRMRQNAIPVDAFGFTVQVDPSRLDFVSASPGNLTTGFAQLNGQETPPGSGTIICGGFNTTPIPANSAGVLIKLCFRVLCPSPSLPASTIEIKSLSDDVASMSACCNLFNCVDCLRNGDVDGNGALSPGDALCAFKIFLNGGILPPECDFPNTTCELVAADPNCDGTVTPGDALAIFDRYLDGLPPLECFARTILSKFEQAGVNQLTLQQHTVMNAREAEGKDLVKVTLAVKHPAGLQAFGLNLHYPAHKLTFMGVRRTASTEKWIQLDGMNQVPGVVTIGGFNTEALSAVSGNELFEAWFKADGEAVNAGDFVLDNLLDDFSSLANEGNRETQSGLAITPEAFRLHQNYPNPFHTGANGKATMIRFDLPGKEVARVELAIYNLSGQLVRRLFSGNHAPGTYEMPWDGRNEQDQLVPSGAYIYKLKVGNFVDSKTLTVVR